MPTDFYTKYELLSEGLLEPLKVKYFESVDKARDWKLAHQKFQEEIIIPLTNKFNAELKELGTIGIHFFQEWDEEFQLNKSKDRPEIFNEKVNAIEASKREQSIDVLVKMNFQHLWITFWLDQYKRRDKAYEYAVPVVEYDERYSSPLFWKGKNGTEFVQLVYALYDAGYIENEEKEITTLVEQLAEILNIDLGKHWQSNHSKSINNTNSDYSPKIFKELEKSFLSRRETQINKKNKN